jgi:hypothetical protein
MAITWGTWEYSGGNGMRTGMEVTWSAVTTASTTSTATVKIYTENQYSYSDGQTLTYGGSISGTTSYTNGEAGGVATLRATKTYTYTYGSSEYVTSPGNRTFTATVSGAYNGVTPSVSVTSAIPARPGGVVRVWNGTAWVSVVPKVWNGSAWVTAQARVWNGTEWKYGI